MLHLRDITKAYAIGLTAHQALKGVDLSLSEGEFCALVGPSGSGKTTLMNIIGLLDPPSTGKVEIDGRDVGSLDRWRSAKARNELIGFVFQSFELLPRLSVWENVALPLTYRGIGREARKKPALDALERLHMAAFRDRLPTQLSGGQRQRVAIARALVGGPKIILADEPTGNLDSATAADVIDLLEEINVNESATILIVTHDNAVAARCRRRIELADGQVVADVPSPAQRSA